MIFHASRLGMRESLGIDSPFIGGWDAEGLFSRPAGARYHSCGDRRVATRGGGAFRGQRHFGGKMAAALVSAEERRPEAARREHFAAGRVLGRDFGSDRPAAGPDLGRNGCRTAQATDQNQPQFALAFSRPTQHHSQKKPCKQPNGSEQMWRGRAAGGYESKVCLILPGWCLSTRPPSARIW